MVELSGHPATQHIVKPVLVATARVLQVCCSALLCVWGTGHRPTAKPALLWGLSHSPQCG